MATELLFCDSFDYYDDADILSKWVAAPGLAIITPGRTNNGAIVRDLAELLLTLPNEYDRFIVGFGYHTTHFTGRNIVQFSNARFSSDLILRLVHIGDGRLKIDFGGNIGASDSEVITGFVMHTDRWYHITMSGTLSAGDEENEVNCAWVVAINCAQIASGSFSRVIVGAFDAPTWATLLFRGALSGQTSIIDDVWLTNDSDLGDCRIYVAKPDGAGDSTEWTPNTGANWQAVDDSPPDYDTTYVETSLVGDKDLYTLSDISSLGPIKGVQALWLATKTDAGQARYENIIKVNSNEIAIGEHYPSFNSWLYRRIPMYNNPDTGEGWEEDEINGMQQGQERLS